MLAEDPVALYLSVSVSSLTVNHQAKMLYGKHADKYDIHNAARLPCLWLKYEVAEEQQGVKQQQNCYLVDSFEVVWVAAAHGFPPLQHDDQADRSHDLYRDLAKQELSPEDNREAHDRSANEENTHSDQNDKLAFGTLLGHATEISAVLFSEEGVIPLFAVAPHYHKEHERYKNHQCNHEQAKEVVD